MRSAIQPSRRPVVGSAILAAQKRQVRAACVCAAAAREGAASMRREDRGTVKPAKEVTLQSTRDPWVVRTFSLGSPFFTLSTTSL